MLKLIGVWRRLARRVHVVLWTKRSEVDKRSDDEMLIYLCVDVTGTTTTTQQGNLFIINHQGLDKLKKNLLRAPGVVAKAL